LFQVAQELLQVRKRHKPETVARRFWPRSYCCLT
jgi:hypothetical protein